MRPPASARRPRSWRRRRRSCAWRRSTSPIPRSMRRSTARSAAPRHRRQCRLAELRAAGDHRQPGSDVRAVPDRAAGGARPGEALRRPGRLERRGDQAAPAGRHDVRPDGQDRLCRADRAATTDTILLRGRIPNPPLKPIEPGKPVDRRADRRRVRHRAGRGHPAGRWRSAIPRAAVLSDQQGDYVYRRGRPEQVEQRRIQLGQSTPVDRGDHAGLKEGEMVVVEGIQRVRPGIQVAPGPAARRRRHAPQARRDQ